MQDYSPPIDMWLTVGSQHLDVGRAGPNFLGLKQSTDAPPGEGVLHICVDGEDSLTQVYLPDGLSSKDTEPRIEVLGVVAAP